MSFRPFQDPPFSLGNLQEEMSRLVERVWHAGLSTGPFDGQKWAPLVDMYEHEDHYTLFVEVPGVDPAEVEVTHLGQTLTIRGEKHRPPSVGESDRPVRGERRFGSFCRSVELPGDIEAARLSAKYHGGVLEINIPKSESSKPKTVKIRVEDK